MEINGPLILSVQEDETSLKRELHISFKPAFEQMDVPGRVSRLGNYMNELGEALQELPENDPDRSGMATVYQICKNLLDHIRADEIDLSETIIMEIQPSISIASFVSGQSSIN
ncbi:MAG: hypothetical protein PVJ72_16495 [Gammaproteobacteria bacterium]|jgi:hypothetical protein